MAISFFSRSISSSGMRAMNFPFGGLTGF